MALSRELEDILHRGETAFSLKEKNKYWQEIRVQAAIAALQRWIKNNEMKFTIELNERQLHLMEWSLENTARLIQGQLDFAVQDIAEEAWCRDHKTEEHPHGVGSKEWYAMRHHLEGLLNEIRELCWNQKGGEYYGLHYDDTADVLWDMHKAIEHARYEAMLPEEKESLRWTVMADPPMRVGNEELISVKNEGDMIPRIKFVPKKKRLEKDLK